MLYIVQQGHVKATGLRVIALELHVADEIRALVAAAADGRLLLVLLFAGEDGELETEVGPELARLFQFRPPTLELLLHLDEEVGVDDVQERRVGHLSQASLQVVQTQLRHFKTKV